MQAQEFVRKWRAGAPAHGLNERADAQAHVMDLCRVLAVPEPGDPDSHCFGRGAIKTGSAAAGARGRTALAIDSERLQVRCGPPSLGAASVVLLEELGYSAEQIARLQADGVVGG